MGASCLRCRKGRSCRPGFPAWEASPHGACGGLGESGPVPPHPAASWAGAFDAASAVSGGCSAKRRLRPLPACRDEELRHPSGGTLSHFPVRRLETALTQSRRTGHFPSAGENGELLEEPAACRGALSVLRGEVERDDGQGETHALPVRRVATGEVPCGPGRYPNPRFPSAGEGEFPFPQAASRPFPRAFRPQGEVPLSRTHGPALPSEKSFFGLRRRSSQALAARQDGLSLKSPLDLSARKDRPFSQEPFGPSVRKEVSRRAS